LFLRLEALYLEQNWNNINLKASYSLYVRYQSLVKRNNPSSVVHEIDTSALVLSEQDKIGMVSHWNFPVGAGGRGKNSPATTLAFSPAQNTVALRWHSDLATPSMGKPAPMEHPHESQNHRPDPDRISE
jgi:hypothetical protein